MNNSEIAKEALDDFSKNIIKPAAKKLSKKIIKQRLIDKKQKQDHFQVMP